MHSQIHAQRSSISQNTRSTTQLDTDVSDSELIKIVNDLKRQIKILTLENEVIERTIIRLEPSLMHGIQQALEYALRMQSSSSLNVGSFGRSISRYGLDSLASPSRMLFSPSKVSTRRVDSSAKISGTIIFGTGPKINVLERSELVSAEMEIIVKNLEKSRKKAAKSHALLKAQLEEIGIREENIKKAIESFNQEVIVDGWDNIAQRIPAEIWIRFMTEWAKMADSQIGKLRLRTSTLNTQYSKLKGQIKLKAELSESLRPVDFEKLRIENKVSLETIDNKLQQLVELKKMTGDANLSLTLHKKSMLEQNTYLTRILNMIKEKQKQTVLLDKERDIVQIQVDSLANKLGEVKKIRMAYEVPDIMEYVRVKSEVTDLKHSVKLLENRLHIQDIALKSLNKKLKSIFMNV